ncbi:sugar ABC transporter permease [Clostridia bacterium]|nr:sugar ABC transporter permease [Clostridia bacterium]
MTQPHPRPLTRALRVLKRDHQLLVLLLPGLVFYAVFRYGPMYGILIAFKKYSPFLGIMRSPWVGAQHFVKFFRSSDFFLLLRNTFLLGVYSLLFSFPATLLFALLLNEVMHPGFKKAVQTIAYLPTFLSVVIVCSMTIELLSPQNGLINKIIMGVGRKSIYFLIKPEWYRTFYIASGIWASLGSGAIIFLAALSGIDPALYEAATLDGCRRLGMVRHITLPSILPTIVTMFILQSANVMRIGADKTLLLYNPMTYAVSDIIASFVYRKGIVEKNFSYGAAVGLFESVVACAILLSTNALSRWTTGESLW